MVPRSQISACWSFRTCSLVLDRRECASAIAPASQMEFQLRSNSSRLVFVAWAKEQRPAIPDESAATSGCNRAACLRESEVNRGSGVHERVGEVLDMRGQEEVPAKVKLSELRQRQATVDFASVQCAGGGSCRRSARTWQRDQDSNFCRALAARWVPVPPIELPCITQPVSPSQWGGPDTCCGHVLWARAVDMLCRHELQT